MRKLLNALNARLKYRGFKIGQVSNPFDDQLHVAVMNPEGKIIDVYLPTDYTDYDYLAKAIVETVHDRVVIKPPSSTESQEETDA